MDSFICRTRFFAQSRSRGGLAANVSILFVTVGEEWTSCTHFVIGRGAADIAMVSLTQHDRHCRATAISSRLRKSAGSLAAAQACSSSFHRNPAECIGNGTNGFEGGTIQRYIKLSE